MMVELNGRATELPEEATLSDAVSAAGADQTAKGIAAAVGGEVVPRSKWPERVLREGDDVEVVRAVQGG